MGIRVKHGDGDISGLAALSALAGMMQARVPQAQLPTPTGQRGSGGGGGGQSDTHRSIDRANALRAAAGMQKQRIDAAAKQQKLAADQAMAKTAVASGLGQEIKEQEYELEVKKLREQAKIEAEQWEHKFTAQQRQEIQKWNNALANVEASSDYTEEEKASFRKRHAIAIAGIQPSQVPADPNKPKFEDGRGPGQVYEGADKGLYTTVIGSSRLPEAKLIVRPDQRQEYGIELKKMDVEQKRMEREQAQQDAREKFRLSQYDKEVDVFDKLGKKTGTRLLEQREIDERMRSAFPEPPVAGGPGPEGYPAGEDVPWWTYAEREGMNPTENDKALPPNVGFSQMYIRNNPNRPNEGDPGRKLWDKARSALEEFRQFQRGG